MPLIINQGDKLPAAMIEARRMWVLAAATLERDVLLHGMTADEQDVMIGAVLNASLNRSKHDFWGAGEPDCPREIKAGNGELHTLRCKVCGEDNPRDERCLATSSDRITPEWCLEMAPLELGHEVGAGGESLSAPRDDGNAARPDPEQQDRPRTAVHSLSAGNSELEPDDRQNQRSRNADRQGGEGRQVGGRSALLPSGLQRGERDVRREDGNASLARPSPDGRRMAETENTGSGRKPDQQVPGSKRKLP